MNVITQLPDSIANQIAAGEVVQRPASVVKELVENAVDAKANSIIVTIADAGKTLIQVADNGTGMTEIDARMAFERHATSKIKNAQDLFRLTTMGFRGEALASIAAISKIELKTRYKDAELGTQIEISGSLLKLQEVVQCGIGSVFSIKNLFFNIPARRKFLKSDQTEFRHITDEFCRVAIVNSETTFKLIHNSETIYNLPKTNFKQRIVDIFGKPYSENLIPIEYSTNLVNIHGFIGNPKLSKKTNYDQFFFVNNRYMRHPYFNKAIQNAFEKIIPQGTQPSYFICFKINPEAIDVNIHPTKTEIKFENERDIWQILFAATKSALGKFNFVPSINFDFSPEIPINYNQLNINDTTQISKPNLNLSNTSLGVYNKPSSKEYFERPSHSFEKQTDWQKILNDFEKNKPIPFTDNKDEIIEEQRTFTQIKHRFILTIVKSGIMLIDQHRAHSQILYEDLQYSNEFKNHISQPLLFPQPIEIEKSKILVVDEIIPHIAKMGFKVEKQNGTYNVLAIPSILPTETISHFFELLVYAFLEKGSNFADTLNEQICLKMADVSSVQYGKELNHDEMRHLTDKLLACESPNYTTDGKTIMQIITIEEILNRFKN